MHRKEVEDRAKGRVVVRSLKPFSVQVVDAVVTSKMDDGGAQRLFQNTRNTGRQGIYYRTVIRGNEVEELSLLKELEWAAGQMLRSKMVRDRVSQSGLAQQAGIARVQSKVRYHDEQGSADDRRDRAGSTVDGGEESSLRGPERKCIRKKYGKWMFFSAVHKKSSGTLDIRKCCTLGFALG